MKRCVYIGPAGWSYPDWKGVVYPPGASSDFDSLRYLSSYFNLIEINSTFYRIPTRRVCEGWLDRISDRTDFRFTAKAYREFTHGERFLSSKEITAFKNALAVLHEGGRLGTVLIQFPWSFRFSTDACAHVKALSKMFNPLPTSIEARHGSWSTADALRFFTDNDLTLCGIDQPIIGRSLTPETFYAGSSGPYFRLHGRNRAEWFRPGAGRDMRYNYLYSPDELAEWARRIETAAGSVKAAYVVLNNHFRGQAVANALELRALLLGEKVTAPAPLLEAYPRLSSVARASGAENGTGETPPEDGIQRRLF